MVINEDSSQYKHSYILELYNHQKHTKQPIQITLKKQINEQFFKNQIH